MTCPSSHSWEKRSQDSNSGCLTSEWAWLTTKGNHLSFVWAIMLLYSLSYLLLRRILWRYTQSLPLSNTRPPPFFSKSPIVSSRPSHWCLKFLHLDTVCLNQNTYWFPKPQLLHLTCPLGVHQGSGFIGRVYRRRANMEYDTLCQWMCWFLAKANFKE